MGSKRKKSKGLDHTRRQILIFFAVLLGLQAILLFVSIGYKSTETELHNDERALLHAREITHNARVKSNDLYLLAKDAAKFGDLRDIRDYESRTRTSSSDADHEGGGWLQPLLAVMRRLSTRAAAFQDDELSKFEETISKMKVQFAAEKKAVNALKGFFQDIKGEFSIEAPADPKLASQILSDPEYEKTVRDIQKGFSAFLSDLDVRLFAIHKESSRSFRINFILALASILLAATAVAGIFLYRSVSTTIRKLKINARNLTDELGRVNNELHAAVVSREDMRRQLERVSALGGPAAVATPPSPPRDDSQPEFNDFLTRLP